MNTDFFSLSSSLEANLVFFPFLLLFCLSTCGAGWEPDMVFVVCLFFFVVINICSPCCETRKLTEVMFSTWSASRVGHDRVWQVLQLLTFTWSNVCFGFSDTICGIISSQICNCMKLHEPYPKRRFIPIGGNFYEVINKTFIVLIYYLFSLLRPRGFICSTSNCVHKCMHIYCTHPHITLHPANCSKW